jgi:hypothetical protein
MPRITVLPPVECCRGTNPSHAARSRPFANAAALRRDQSHVVSLRDQNPPEVVRAAAGLHPHETGRQVRQRPNQLRARALSPNDNPAARIKADEVKAALADVNAVDRAWGSRSADIAEEAAVTQDLSRQASVWVRVRRFDGRAGPTP